MDTFESQHPRHRTGKFAGKHDHAPTGQIAVTLPDGTAPQPASVGIDGMTFPAAHLPETRWNGWACPQFTREVAQQVTEWANQNAGDDDARFEWIGDALFEVFPEGDEADPQVVGTTKLSDGTVLYRVGAHSWTWSDQDDE